MKLFACVLKYSTLRADEGAQCGARVSAQCGAPGGRSAAGLGIAQGKTIKDRSAHGLCVNG